MLKVVVIGSGNVAQHLIKAFQNSAHAELVQAYARNPEKLAHLLPPEKITQSYTSLATAHVYVISVSDDVIENVSTQLPFEGRLVVHTSGSVPLNQPDNKNRRGVFYTQQKF
jgi:pyrroline-5-carboxylate reductase